MFVVGQNHISFSLLVKLGVYLTGDQVHKGDFFNEANMEYLLFFFGCCSVRGQELGSGGRQFVRSRPAVQLHNSAAARARWWCCYGQIGSLGNSEPPSCLRAHVWTTIGLGKHYV